MPGRLAILPTTLLTEDDRLDWLTSAGPLILVEDLTSGHRYAPVPVANTSAAYSGAARAILRSSLEVRQGRPFLTATVTDLASQQTDLVFEQQASGGQLVALFDQLAQRMDPAAGTYSGHRDAAIQLFAGVLTGNGSSADRTALLEHAVNIDPSYATAWISLMSLEAARDPATVPTLLARAEPNATRFDRLGAARFQAVAAQLSEAPLAEQARTAEQLVAIAAYDTEALVSLARLENKLAHFDRAGQLLDRTLALNPRNVAVADARALNLLRIGKKQEGSAAASQMLQLNPGDPTLIRARAELQVAAGEFAAAAASFQTLASDPSALIAEAAAHYLDHNPAAATNAFDRFLRSRSAVKDPYLALAAGTWAAATGTSAPPGNAPNLARAAEPALEPLLRAQQSIWSLAAGNRAEALQLARAAAAGARDANAQALSKIALLLAASDNRQLIAAVQQSGLSPAVATSVVAFGQYLQGDFNAAATSWQRLFDRNAATNDEPVRTMLALSLAKSGHATEANALRALPFIPNLSGSDPFAIVLWRAMLEWQHLGMKK